MAGVKGRSGGGNKKSVEELKLNGTYRADRHANVLVATENRVRVLPQDHILQPNPVINREEIFNYFADVLHKQGMTQEVDSVLLSQLVEAQAIYLTALVYFKSDPEAVLGKKLASSVALDAAKEVRSLLNEFRLSPSSRTIQIEDKSKVTADPIAAFLNMRVVGDS